MKEHESLLIEKLVVVTFSTNEHYEWVLDSAAKARRYFTLRCATNHKVVFSRSIDEIKHATPQDLVFNAIAESARADARARPQTKA